MTVTYGPRHRELKYAKRDSSLAWYHTDSAGNTTKQHNCPIDWQEHAETMDDVVVENFYARREAGELMNNPMHRVVTDTHRTMWGGKLPVKNENRFFSGFHPSPLLTVPFCGPPSGRDAKVLDAITYASTKALGKVTSEDTQALVTLGELRETKHMLKNTLAHVVHWNGALKYYRDRLYDLRNSAWKKAGIVYQHAENAWMQVRMGWRPLIGEIENTAKAFQALPNVEERQTFRGFETLSFTNADNYEQNCGFANVSVQRTYYETVEVRAGVLASLRYGGVPDTWGVTKIPQTIWELTTLSWCVDYFYNVADTIAAYTPDSLWTPRIRWCTTKSRKVLENSHQGISAYHPYGDATTQQNARVTRIIVDKSRIVSPPVGLVRKPNSLEFAELIDTCAVARQKTTSLISSIAGILGSRRR